MQLDLCRRGASVALVILLFAVACGTASQEQPRAREGSSKQSDESIVATIDGKPITLEDVDAKVLATNVSVFQELYDARREALGELVAEALLTEEASSRGISREELLEEEVAANVAPVTEEDVQAFYDQNRARLGGQSFDQIEAQIREYLVARSEAAARQAFIDALRSDSDVTIDLEPPRVPIQVASGERVKGPADAPVTIVEYSDFQ